MHPLSTGPSSRNPSLPTAVSAICLEIRSLA
jgi:hypothetical protein